MTIRNELKRFEKRWLRPLFQRFKNKDRPEAPPPDPGPSTRAIAAEIESLVDEHVLLRSELAALRNRFLELEALVEKVGVLHQAGSTSGHAIADQPHL